MKKQASKVAHNQPRPSYFTVQPRPTAHSPELIFHIMKCWDQTSVLLSVLLAILCKKNSHHSAAVNIFSKKMNLINLGKNILMIKNIHQQRNTKITDSYHVYENRSMLFRRFLFLRQKSFHPRYVNLPFPTFFRDHQTMLGFGPTLFVKIFHAIGSSMDYGQAMKE